MNNRQGIHFFFQKVATLFLLLMWACGRLAAQSDDDECASFSNVFTARVVQLGSTAASTGPYCLGSTIQLLGSGGNTYYWTGPNGFVSHQQNPIIANGQFINAGNYFMTVTDSLGCSEMTSVRVTFRPCAENCSNGFDDDMDGLIDCMDEDCALLNFEIQSTDTIFCENQPQTISASGGTSWLWSNGATTSSILVNASANYTVTATNAQGCTATDQIQITTHPKPNATAQILGLSCENQTITFAASGGTFYEWKGPGGLEMHRDTFQLTYLQSAQAGVYRVYVSNAFGCADTAFAALAVGINPDGVVASGGVISCQNTCVNLDAFTALSGAHFSWTGPGSFTSTAQNPQVCTEGIYSLTVTNPATGCFTTDTAWVSRNDSSFTVTCKAMSHLNCLSDSVTIQIEASIDNFHLNLNGPGGYLSHIRNSTAWQSGIYTATVTNLASGCQITCQVEVQELRDTPTVEAWATDLTCTAQGTQLFCNASQPGVRYFWTGPGGFVSQLQNPMVYQKGVFTVKIVGEDSGCESLEAQVEVR